jgi:replicative DNA helicase
MEETNYSSKFNSVALERQMLAMFMQHPQSYYEVSGLIDDEDFYTGNNSYAHRTLFKVIKSMHENGEAEVIDREVLVNKLQAANVTFIDNIDTSEYIRVLMSDPIPSAKAAQSIAEELNDYTTRRLLDKNADKVKAAVKSSNGKNSVELIRECDQIYNSLINKFSSSTSNRNPVLLFEGLLGDLNDRADDPRDVGIPCPTFPIAESIYGEFIIGGEINIIGARPGDGKTTLLLHISTQASLANNNIPVLHLDNGEMSFDQLRYRQVSEASGIPLALLQKGKWRNTTFTNELGETLSEAQVKRRVVDAANECEKRNFHYVNVGGLSVEEQIQVARNFYYSKVGRGKPCILSYDYLKAGHARANAGREVRHVIHENIQRWKDFINEEIVFENRCAIGMLTAAQLNREGNDLNSSGSGQFAEADSIQQLGSNTFVLKRRSPEQEAREHEAFSRATHRLTNLKPRNMGEKSHEHRDVLIPTFDDNGNIVGNGYSELNCIFLRINNFSIEEVGDLSGMANLMRFNDILPDQDGLG